MTEIIIFDLEFTTWEGAMDRSWTGKTETGENEYREIVQIGALKVEWPSGRVLGALNLLVKPKRNPVLSPFFQQLTAITQQRLEEEGIEFPEALLQFLEFCGTRKTCSYGGDALIVAENVALNHCHPGSLYTMNMPEFINIGAAIHRLDPVTKQQRLNSGRLWQHYGLPKPEGVGEHDALFDCYSILAAMRYLHQTGRDVL